MIIIMIIKLISENCKSQIERSLSLERNRTQRKSKNLTKFSPIFIYIFLVQINNWSFLCFHWKRLTCRGSLKGVRKSSGLFLADYEHPETGSINFCDKTILKKTINETTILYVNRNFAFRNIKYRRFDLERVEITGWDLRWYVALKQAKRGHRRRGHVLRRREPKNSISFLWRNISYFLHSKFGFMSKYLEKNFKKNNEKSRWKRQTRWENADCFRRYPATRY